MSVEYIAKIANLFVIGNYNVIEQVTLGVEKRIAKRFTLETLSELEWLLARDIKYEVYRVESTTELVDFAFLKQENA